VIRDLVAIVNDSTFNNIAHADMAAAVAAVDTWATANAAAYNTALPDPFKSTANSAQKALILAYVCLRRAGL
jgi:phage portal protein BeeE